MNDADAFTVLDLKSACWQIRINEFDKHTAAFVVPNAKYLWKVLPFGSADAASPLHVMFNILEEFFNFADE